VKIVYTKHAVKKFNDLEELGIKVGKRLVRKILKQPVHLDDITDYPNLIASGKLRKNYVLRVVHRKEDDIIIIITFYPAKEGRYFK